jgi:hypothetical protein
MLILCTIIVCGREAAKYVNLLRVPRGENVADIFTKSLPRPPFQKFKDVLKMSVAEP